MGFVFKTNIHETANNPGTSTVNLLGQVAGRRPFVDVGSGNTTWYFLADATQTEWGIGTVTAGTPNTLSRDKVLGNSLGTTAKLNFTGTTQVYSEVPAEFIARPVFHDVYLALDGSSNLKLYNANGGNLITIDGVPQVNAEPTLPSSGATVSTLYYIYAYWTGSAVAIERSTTGPATHTDGSPTKTGDSSRHYVGKAYCDGAGAWVDSRTKRYVASYYNRRKKPLVAIGTGISTTTTSAAIVVPCESLFLAWADDDVTIDYFINCSEATGGHAGIAGHRLNGVSVGNSLTLHGPVANYYVGAANSYTFTPNQDGPNIYYPMLHTTAGTLTTAVLQVTVDLRL